jgi:hypothetical protein
MEFDHVITVHEDGSITDGPQSLYAPTLEDEELDDRRWSFFSAGYSGQYGYSGPIMHNSEYIGGRLADDIIATPGIYAAVVAYWTNDDPDDDAGSDSEGWAIVTYNGEVSV